MAEDNTFEVVDRITVRLSNGDAYVNIERVKEELESSVDNIHESLKWFLGGDRAQRYLQENRCYHALAEIVASGILHAKVHEEGLYAQVPDKDCPRVALLMAKEILEQTFPELREVKEE